MDIHKKNRNNYDRVMSRVFNRSRSSLRSSSNVTRHDVSSSVRVGAKPSVSAVSSSVFSELPTVLNDYVPDVESGKVVKRPSVKPRRTLKSLDPGKAKSPPRPPRPPRGRSSGIRNVRARSSVPVVFSNNGEEWAESHVRQCYSSRSHTRLKELKDEIKAFRETDKLLKLRSHLYKSCGVVLDDVGNVAQDKAVQAAPEPDKENTSLRRRQWLEAIGRFDLLARIGLNAKNYAVCYRHFDDSCYQMVRQLREDAIPKRWVPVLPEDGSSATEIEIPKKSVEACTQTEPNPEPEILLNIKSENAEVDPLITIEVPIIQDFTNIKTETSSSSLPAQTQQKRKIDDENKIAKKKKSQNWWKK